jgi:peroxiredoxin Q/BCP
VSFDPPDENDAFARKFDFNFPLLCDTSRALGLAFGACDSADAQYARRIGVVIDGAGRVVRIDTVQQAGAYPAQVLATL